MRHTMAYLHRRPASADAADHISLDWKPVVITSYQPMERKSNTYWLKNRTTS